MFMFGYVQGSSCAWRDEGSSLSGSNGGTNNGESHERRELRTQT